MVTIVAVQLENGEWEAYTEESPWMYVRGDTKDIAVGIVERALVWYQEKTVRIRHEEMLAELNKMVLLPAPSHPKEDES